VQLSGASESLLNIGIKMATDELAKKLTRRCNINEGVDEGTLSPQSTVFNPYTEFKEFSRKDIQAFQKTFNK